MAGEKRKAWCNVKVKLCDRCLSALCVLRTWHYINACIYLVSSAVLHDSLLTVLLHSLHLSMLNKAVFIVYLFILQMYISILCG